MDFTLLVDPGLGDNLLISGDIVYPNTDVCYFFSLGCWRHAIFLEIEELSYVCTRIDTYTYVLCTIDIFNFYDLFLRDLSDISASMFILSSTHARHHCSFWLLLERTK